VRTKPDEGGRGDLFTERYGRCVDGNRAAYRYACSSFIAEICGAVRTQIGFHRASYAAMLHRPFIGLRIFYEMMAFEIRYHVFLRPTLDPNFGFRYGTFYPNARHRPPRNAGIWHACQFVIRFLRRAAFDELAAVKAHPHPQN
jgi:hypothetical protein